MQTFDNPWDFVDYIEKRKGSQEATPKIIEDLKPTLLDSYSNVDELGFPLGNRYWANNIEYVIKLNNFDQQKFEDFVIKRANSKKLFPVLLPRALKWAITTAKNLVKNDVKNIDEIVISPTFLPTFNGTACFGSGFAVILVNVQLMFGLEALNAKYFSLANIARDDVSKFDVNVLSEKRNQLYDEYVKLINWILDPINIPSPRFDKDSRDENLIAAHNTTYFQILFVILHELAHFYAGHLGNTPYNNTEMIFRNACHLEQEHEADRIAFKWYKRIFSGFEMNGVHVDSETARSIGLNSLTALFCAWMVIEGYLITTGSDPDYGTHPGAGERWAYFVVDAQKDLSLAKHLDDEKRKYELFGALI